MHIKKLDFSDYIVFVDESGDHGLKSIDKTFPVFALVFTLIKKDVYINEIVPSLIKLKNKYWGHDQIIFHESDIRKEREAFLLLRTEKNLRDDFYADLNSMIANSSFKFFASVINKESLLKKYSDPYNPYEISLLFCMEMTRNFLISQGQQGRLTHLIIEGRGAREDKELELEFRRIIAKGGWGYKKTDFSDTPFDLICVKKSCNSSGLQLADLIARPIALSILRPVQDNRAYDIIKSKGLIKTFP